MDFKAPTDFMHWTMCTTEGKGAKVSSYQG